MCARRLKRKHDWKVHGRNYDHFSTKDSERFYQEPIILRCTKCEAEFTNRRDLTAHYTKEHAPVKPFACHVCGQAYARKRDLTGHQGKNGHPPLLQEINEVGEGNTVKRKEAKRFDCPQCPATFRFKSMMQVHLRKHTGERPFVCLCGRGFTRKHDMHVHQKAFGHSHSESILTNNIAASVSTSANDRASDASLGRSKNIPKCESTDLSDQVSYENSSESLLAENVKNRRLSAEHQDKTVASVSRSLVGNVCGDYGSSSPCLQSGELEGKCVKMSENEVDNLCETSRSNLSVGGHAARQDVCTCVPSSHSKVDSIDVCDSLNFHEQAAIHEDAESARFRGRKIGKCVESPPTKERIDSSFVNSHSNSTIASLHRRTLSLSNGPKPVGKDSSGFKPLLSKVLSFRFSESNLSGEELLAVQMQASETRSPSLCSNKNICCKSANHLSFSGVAKQVATPLKKEPMISQSPDNNSLRSPEKKGPFECPFCPTVFKFWSLLDVHSRKHTGARPFVCSCGRGFSRKHDRKKHQQKFGHSSTDDNEPASSRNVDSKLTPSATIKFEASNELSKYTDKSEDQSLSEDIGRRQANLNVSENNPSRFLPFVLTSEKIGDLEDKCDEVEDKPEFSNPTSESRNENVCFKCSDCSAVFRYKSWLEIHARKHTRERPYACLCGRAYTRKHDKKVHQRKCREYLSGSVTVKQKSDGGLGNQLQNSQKVGSAAESVEYFQCTKCPSRFKRHGAFILHQEWHLREKPFVCGTCNRNFIRKCDLSSHLNHYGHGGAELKPKKRGLFVKSCPDSQFSYPTCPATYNSNFSLNVHKIKHLPARPHVCDTCGRGFTRKHDRRIHQKTFGHLSAKDDVPKQGPPYKCPHCPAIFKFKCYLRYHSVKHTGKGPLACNQCSTSFVKQSDLMIHKRRHNGERPFLCSLCGYRFSSQGHLTIHVRRKHTGERPFMCSFCGKGFVDRGSMRQHEKVHSEEKDYPCRFCGERFAQLARRWKHEKMEHTEEALKQKLSKQMG